MQVALVAAVVASEYVHGIVVHNSFGTNVSEILSRSGHTRT